MCWCTCIYLSESVWHISYICRWICVFLCIKEKYFSASNCVTCLSHLQMYKHVSVWKCVTHLSNIDVHVYICMNVSDVCLTSQDVDVHVCMWMNACDVPLIYAESEWCVSHMSRCRCVYVDERAHLIYDAFVTCVRDTSLMYMWMCVCGWTCAPHICRWICFSLSESVWHVSHMCIRICVSLSESVWHISKCVDAFVTHRSQLTAYLSLCTCGVWHICNTCGVWHICNTCGVW